MMLPSNPYIAGNPVGNSTAFVGREDVLRAVLRVLRDGNRNAITIYGQRRIGKTSILQYLTVRLPQEGPYVAVYFDLQDRAAKPLGTVLAELAWTIANHLHLPKPNLGQEPERTFRERWLPEALAHLPEGHSLVLLFDEFDTLADPKQGQADKDFFPYLRDLMAYDPAHLQFVFVLGRNVSDLSQIALSLFRSVPDARVSLLSHKETRALIRLAERNQTLRWPDASIERVWALTHGHPYLTQVLCWEVWERLYEEEPDGVPEVRPEDVEAAIAPTLRMAQTVGIVWQGGERKMNIPRIAEISVSREPYLGGLYTVEYHYDDGDTVKTQGFLRTPQGVLELLRTLPAYAVHFVGGGRPTKTYELRRRG